MTLQGEAVRAVPVGRTMSLGIVVRPEDRLDSLPVTATRLVVQLRQQNLLSVKGVELADPGPLENLFRDGDNHRVRALAVELLVLEDQWITFGVNQFGPADELEVGTENGQLLATRDVLALLLGETGNDGIAQGERYPGLRLLGSGPDNQLTAFGGDAGRGDDADHPAADLLEVGDSDVTREHDLRYVRKTGAVDGHRLPGDDLGRKEHLDVQPEVGRFVDLLGVAGRQRAEQDDGQHPSNICKYLLHNRNP